MECFVRNEVIIILLTRPVKRKVTSPALFLLLLILSAIVVIISHPLGKGYCHWTETHGTGDDRRTEHCTGKEEFFEYKLWLCGNGSQRFSHAPGRVEYTFSYTLPASLPSSFESHTGYIRYELKGRSLFIVNSHFF